MCECLRESASVHSCICVCLCVTDVERAVKWDWHGGDQRDVERCPQESRVFLLCI